MYYIAPILLEIIFYDEEKIKERAIDGRFLCHRR